MSNFLRFTTVNNKVVYINISNIYSVERGNDTATCKIISVNGANHLVAEHVEEVLARIEGKDSRAASILFGDKK